MNIKKITIFSLFILSFSFLVFSPMAFAACDRSQTAICNIADVLKVLDNIVGWMYRIFFIVAALFIILAAYNYLTAQGNPETIQKVNKQIFYAIIAIIVALLSLSFDTIIANFLKNLG